MVDSVLFLLLHETKITFNKMILLVIAVIFVVVDVAVVLQKKVEEKKMFKRLDGTHTNPHFALL